MDPHFCLPTDDYSDENLDAEFRQILCIIKDSIPQVNSNYKLNLYTSWLEKLSAKCSDKALRNTYLLELARQVRGNILLPPFDKKPNGGRLKILNETYLTHGNDVATSNTNFKDTKLEKSPQSYLAFLSENYPEIKKFIPDYNEGDSFVVPEYPKEIEVFKCVSKKSQVEKAPSVRTADDSSWCDMSDSSLDSTFANRSVDSEQRIGSQITMTNSFKSKKQHNSKYTKSLVADWKKTIESLQLRLTETLNQNNELKQIIKSLTLHIQQNKTHKLQDEHSKHKLLEEMENLKRSHEETLGELEKSFKLKLNEAEKSYKKKLEEAKSSYEWKIRKMKYDQQEKTGERDMEISRLTQIIHEQCKRISKEIIELKQQLLNMSKEDSNANEKVTVLQKCVSKMDKLFQKSEKEYTKQIEQLKKDMELKDRMMQMQLKTQKAELATKACNDKQKQFDEIANNLEVKYIKMMEYHEAEVVKLKKEDDERIEYLMELLEKNGIPFSFN